MQGRAHHALHQPQPLSDEDTEGQGRPQKYSRRVVGFQGSSLDSEVSWLSTTPEKLRVTFSPPRSVIFLSKSFNPALQATIGSLSGSREGETLSSELFPSCSAPVDTCKL